jgi:hypothetical protein
MAKLAHPPMVLATVVVDVECQAVYTPLEYQFVILLLMMIVGILQAQICKICPSLTEIHHFQNLIF